MPSLPECPFEKEKEFPVQLRKTRKLDAITKRADAEEFDNLVSDVKEATPASATVEEFLKLQPEELMVKLDSAEPIVQCNALEAIKRLLAKTTAADPLVDVLISSNLIPKCLELIRLTEVPMVATEALMILNFISAGNTKLTQALLRSETALPILLDILKTSVTLSDKAMLTLGNIAADSVECRNFLFDHGIVDAVLDLGKNYLPNLYIKKFSWMISNLCRSRGLHHKFNEAQRLIPLIKKFLKESREDETHFHCCVALHRLIFDGDVKKIQAVVDSGVIPPLVRLVNINHDKPMSMALKVIGEIASGTAEHTGKLVSSKLLRKLVTLLQYDNRETMQSTLWILGNLCADSRQNIQAIIDAEVFTFMYPILADGAPECKLEAAVIMKNVIVHGTDRQVNSILSSNSLLNPLCRLLNAKCVNTVSLAVHSLCELFNRRKHKEEAVAELKSAVEGVGVVETIESLQFHDNKEIAVRASFLVDKFLDKKH